MLIEQLKDKFRRQYESWFTNNNYIVFWESMEFINQHIKVDAKNLQTGKVDMFFMTSSHLKKRVGFGKEHQVILHNAAYRPDKINKMRQVIE
ncbi:hypothetical protein P7H60_13690 [Vagococcus carniphilus]|uniref:hypothetical protein n=1 Tax=Vagococcus carniphilus TaxID=218144 RepID=UPI00288E99A2|nr:hypothetical protein [Vagococcus carniphilus]MDT2850202.1 hypothetical protein [Vagococcus carniphilus]